MIKVVPLHFKELDTFLNFPGRLYADCPWYIPAMYEAERKMFDTASNPVFDHAVGQCFIAYKGKLAVGRIAAIINHQGSSEGKEKQGRFGWLDMIDDIEVTKALLLTASQWLSARGMTRIAGPYGFSNLDKAGFVIEGFEGLGVMSTWYNFPYYVEHLQQLGYAKENVWIEKTFSLDTELPEKIIRVNQLVKTRYGLCQISIPSKKILLQYATEIFEVLEDAYQYLPGFVPFSEKQKIAYTKSYLRYLNPKYVVLIEDSNKKMVGFGISMISMSNALKKSKGKLFPFGWWYLAQAQRYTQTADLLLIGIRQEWQKKGVHGLVYQQMYHALKDAGIKKIHINPMLEVNASVLNTFEAFSPKVFRRRATFEKSIH